MAGRYYLRTQGKSEGVPESELIRLAIQSMGLNDVAPFDPAKKIIEYQFKEFEKPLIDMTVRDFADELSTDSPAPGGGSVSALCGSLAASLTTMVANLTHGKKGYEQQFKKMNDLAIEAQHLKDELLRFVDLDTAAFNKVMDSFRLPKKTEEEKAGRAQAIQDATKEATIVPLSVMKTTFKVLGLVDTVSKYGNVNSISDAGVAALVVSAAVKGAGFNVLINLPGIEDKEFCYRMRSEVAELNEDTQRIVRRIVKRVEKKIAEM